MIIPELSPTPHLGQRGQAGRPYDAVGLAPVALSVESRRESATVLRGIVADTTVMYRLYRKHERIVAGPTRREVQVLFGKHTSEQLKLVDLLEDRIHELVGSTIGDARGIAETIGLAGAADGRLEVPAMIGRLLDGHKAIIAAIRMGIERTDMNGDWETNDLLVGDVLWRNELQVWFITKHLAHESRVDPSPMPNRGVLTGATR